MNKTKIRKEILEYIKKYQRIFIFSHMRPDGDCIGSALGLKGVIKATFPEKEVYHLGDYSKYLAFLGSSDEITDEALFAGSLGIIVDTATAPRVFDQRFRLCETLIKIDHHDDSDTPGVINLIEERKPANCQIITELVISWKNQVVLDEQSAKCLYAGILTDTGFFRYRGVDEHTFKAASFLVSKGIEVDVLTSKLSETSLPALKFKGFVINNIQTIDKVAFCQLSQDDIKNYGVSYEDASNQVNTMAGMVEYPVWALILEYSGGKYRVRLRSQGIDIIPISQEFNGGGHPNATGIELDNRMQVKYFLQSLVKYVNEYKY
jgi:phosphoesterase RecJ-like protein